MVKIEIYPNCLNPERLALLYVTLQEIRCDVEAQAIYQAGLANCGKREFDVEVSFVKRQLKSLLNGADAENG